MDPGSTPYVIVWFGEASFSPSMDGFALQWPKVVRNRCKELREMSGYVSNDTIDLPKTSALAEAAMARTLRCLRGSG
ncbi:hypothetical protein CCGE531_28565 (plasmid) [Rhizobium sp. CCGE531]|nr:hypothetical protein CCGE531_28565 [Rhizobium sp. CCGE531]AYG76398.1 hypothetical protein CCGE532_28040 [Rhizobium sp. CCGE532]